MHENQRRLLTGLLVAAVAIAAAAVGSRVVGRAGSRSAVSHVVTRLGDAAPVSFRVLEQSGRVDTTTFRAQSLGIAHWTVSQLSSQLPGWSIEVKAGAVTLTAKKDAKPLYVGILQGHVAIFFGPPRYGWVDRLTGLRAQSIGAQDLARLESGIPVANVGQAWQLLEGLGG